MHIRKVADELQPFIADRAAALAGDWRQWGLRQLLRSTRVSSRACWRIRTSCYTAAVRVAAKMDAPALLNGRSASEYRLIAP
jgi:hypothetical protein